MWRKGGLQEEAAPLLKQGLRLRLHARLSGRRPPGLMASCASALGASAHPAAWLPGPPTSRPSSCSGGATVLRVGSRRHKPRMRKVLAVGILIVGIWVFPPGRAVSAVSTSPCGQPPKPCPSPSPSVSPSPSPSPSPTPSPSQTPSPTGSPTQRPSPSGGSSPTASPRPSHVRSLSGVPPPSVFRPSLILSSPTPHPSTGSATSAPGPLPSSDETASGLTAPQPGDPLTSNVSTRGWLDPQVIGVFLFVALVLWAAVKYDMTGRRPWR
jgi:hypothetical protein